MNTRSLAQMISVIRPSSTITLNLPYISTIHTHIQMLQNDISKVTNEIIDIRISTLNGSTTNRILGFLIILTAIAVRRDTLAPFSWMQENVAFPSNLYTLYE